MPAAPDDLFDVLSRKMTMRQMRMLLAIAEQRSVIRAARDLRVAQPALSRALGELERALGVVLFDRSPRGMTATVFGEALLRRIRAVFAELRDAGQELQSLQDGSFGHVTIGCTRLLVAGALPRVLAVFLHERAGVDVSIVEGTTNLLMENLRARNVDIVVGRLPATVDRNADLRYEHLFEESLYLVSARHHPLARRRRVSLLDTLEHAWLLPGERSMLFRVIAETFAKRGLALPAARVQVESPRIMLELVASAGLLALVPGSNLGEAAARRRFAILSRLEAVPYGPVGYMTLRAKEPTPATRAFISVLRRDLSAISGARK